MTDKIKKIIAREGLVILSTLALGLLLIILGNLFHPHNSNIPYGILGEKAYQYDLMIANRFLLFGVILAGLYISYFLIRFIIWAIRTLRKK